MSEPLFLSLGFGQLAAEIGKAERAVCYAAPGIQELAGTALAAAAARLGPKWVTVFIDFDENVLRMGFGTFEAVAAVRKAGVAVQSTPGLRTGLVVIDDFGYIFTPTALFLEAEAHNPLALNAMRLTRTQVAEAQARLSPAAKTMAMLFAKTDEEKQHIREQAVEVPSVVISEEQVAAVATKLEAAPPLNFDVARQVRVFNAYLQYVEMSLTGAAVQRRRLTIPPAIQQLGVGSDIEGRLRTTFDLIDRSGALSSKSLEDRLNSIRKNFTPTLGKKHGRVVLKASKALLEQRLDEFRADLAKHQANVEAELQKGIDASISQIIAYYVPIVTANPPDIIRARTATVTAEVVERWLGQELARVVPTASELVGRMTLDVQFKDVTFETLNQPDFLEGVKAAFPDEDWEKTYRDFIAVGEATAPRA